MRPYYEQDGITIYHGDCRDVLPSIRADVCITDPPYGRRTYPTDLTVTPEWFRQITEYGTAAVFGYPEDLVRLCVATRREPAEWVTWWATNKTLGKSPDRLPKESEHVAIFGHIVGAGRIFRKRSSETWTKRIVKARGLSSAVARDGDVWRSAAPGMGFNSRLRLHPNEKPIDVMTRLVLLCSDLHQTIVDPHAGSGTTLVAAKSLGRKGIGVELDERYCETASKRLAATALALPLEVSA